MEISIVPQPRKVVEGAGSFDPRGRAWSVHPSAASHKAVAHKLKALGARVKKGKGLSPLTIAVGEVAPGSLKAPKKSEGYALSIAPEGLALAGADLDGLFWGLVTLEQMLLSGPQLPAVTITDWPEIAIRGHHDDVSRKQISTLEDFKRIVRLLSRFKVNYYTPYMEDTLHIKSFPDIGEGRGKLMPDEVRELVAEGERHNVEIMPTYSLIGHQENLLSLPRYAHLGRKVFQKLSTYDPAKPELRKFLKKVIADACALFPCEYFHMCFDETQGVQKDLFFEHANWCARELVRHGKTPVMWVDMVYNHWGCKAIKKLHPKIVPVDWDYGDTSKGVHHWEELSRQGRPVWGLAGYRNSPFLPDSERTKDHFEGWMRQLARVPGGALFSSMWGDGGYENSRDLTWNLYAALGEYTWSGAAADRKTFERRFQQIFYGRHLSELERIVTELPRRLSLPAGSYKGMHHVNAYGMLRYAAANREQAAAFDRDEKLLVSALADLKTCSRRAKREKGHLDHYEVSLRRMLSVVHRLQFAFRHARRAHRLAGDTLVRMETRKLVAELRKVRDRYAEVWLRHNKRPNIEVSLAAFDRAAESFLQITRPPRETGRIGVEYRPLDLTRHYDVDFLPIGGIPIGPVVLNDVPFAFAGVDKTHVNLSKKNRRIELSFEPALLRDVHLIVTGSKPHDGEPLPALRLELLRHGKVTYTEELKAIRHLCDWWAPLDEHIWAGGGFKFVDPKRVRFALKPANMYGLTEVLALPLDWAVPADGMRLTSLGAVRLELFAATLEVQTAGDYLKP